MNEKIALLTAERHFVVDYNSVHFLMQKFTFLLYKFNIQIEIALND